MVLKLSLNVTESNPTDFTKWGYRTVDVLTPGQFGKTYVVLDASQTSWVAKSVDLSSLTEKEKQNCKLEADLLMLLDHPAILKCRETFMNGESLVLILEHCKGGDLQHHMDERVKDGKEYSEGEIYTIMSKLLEALHYLHVDKKIIHRDIKPANILIHHDGALESIKIADFGISKMMNQTLQMAQTHIGTPAYMSPEMLRGHHFSDDGSMSGGYSFASDIWALGCVLWELSCGKSMYGAQSIGNLVHIITNRRRKTPKICREDLSSELKSIIYLMLSQSVAQRSTPAFYLSKRYFQVEGGLRAGGAEDDFNSDGTIDVVDIDTLGDILRNGLQGAPADDTSVNAHSIVSFLRYYREVMHRGGVLEVFMVTAMDKEVENGLEFNLDTIEENEDEEDTIDSDVSDNERTLYQTRKIKKALLTGQPNATDCPDVCFSERWDIAWLKRGNTFFQMGLGDEEMHEIGVLLSKVDFDEHSGENLVRDIHALFGTVDNLNQKLVDLWRKYCIFRLETVVGKSIEWMKDSHENEGYILFGEPQALLTELDEALNNIRCTGDICVKSKSKSAFKSVLVNKIQRQEGKPLTPDATDLLYRGCKRGLKGEVILTEFETEMKHFVDGSSKWNYHPRAVRQKSGLSSPKGGRSIRSRRNSSAKGLRPYHPKSAKSSCTSVDSQTPHSSASPTLRRPPDFGLPEVDSASNLLKSLPEDCSDAQSFADGSAPYNSARLAALTNQFNEGLVDTPCEFKRLTRNWEGSPQSCYRPNLTAPSAAYARELMLVWTVLTDMKYNTVLHMIELIGLVQDDIAHTAKVIHLKYYTQKHGAKDNGEYSERELEVEIELIHAIRDRLECHLSKCQESLGDLAAYCSHWDEQKIRHMQMSTPLARERGATSPAKYFKINLKFLSIFTDRYRSFCFAFDQMCDSTHPDMIPDSLAERKEFTKQFGDDIERCIVWISDVLRSFVPCPTFYQLVKYHLYFSIDEEFVYKMSDTIRTVIHITEETSVENALLTAFISLDNDSIIQGRNHLLNRVIDLWEERINMCRALPLHHTLLRSFRGFLKALDRRDQNIIDFFQSTRFTTEAPNTTSSRDFVWHRNKLLRLSADWRFSRLYMLSDSHVVIRNLANSLHQYIKKDLNSVVEQITPWYERRNASGFRSPSYNSEASGSRRMMNAQQTSQHSSRSIQPMSRRDIVSTPVNPSHGVRFNESGDPNASPARTYHAFEDNISGSSPGTPAILRDMLPSPKQIGILKRTKSRGTRTRNAPTIHSTYHSHSMSEMDMDHYSRGSFMADGRPRGYSEEMFDEMDSYDTPMQNMRANKISSFGQQSWHENHPPTPLTTLNRDSFNVMTPSPLQYQTQNGGHSGRGSQMYKGHPQYQSQSNLSAHFGERRRRSSEEPCAYRRLL
eukprot:GHVH01006534.1.p1 GENE.GHVH01006534.1~~GHVH01006534.1.p1  ORF type:complete len:1397 (+),score=187.79 GHVH01006534.1:100-4290(+)